MLQFRVHNVVPPGGRYFYEPPETGVALEARTPWDLLALVTRHLRENGKAVPDNLSVLIEDFMCRRLPESFCFGELDGKPRQLILTLAEIRARTLAWIRGRAKAVPGDSRRRAEVCGACPANDRTLCPTCIGLISWALRQVGETSNGVDGWLGVCQHDGVALAAKIRVAAKATDAEQAPYPENCWCRG
jgi:hypothetical protein